MLTHWRTLLDTDCRVVVIGDNVLYPIFKNGSTSLFADADRVLTNEHISAEDIVVFIRDPEQRFVKGVNQYCAFNELDVEETYQRIRAGDLMDRHFVPQWIWLLHLYKYHKGTVTLKAMDDMGHYCYHHTMKQRAPLVNIEPLDDFVSPDTRLIKYLNQTVQLEELIKR